jgi:hypothetical protein
VSGSAAVGARRIVLIAVVGVLVLALVGGLVALSRYAPLEPGVSSAGGGLDEGSTDYRPGGTFFLIQSVRNDGRLPVTITGIRVDTSAPFALELGYLPDGSTNVSPDAAQPLRKLRLDQGEQALLVLNGRFRNPCVHYAAGSFIRQESIRVEYTVLGRHRRQRVALDKPLEVRFPEAVKAARACR